jgi:hypothetical protein
MAKLIYHKKTHFYHPACIFYFGKIPLHGWSQRRHRCGAGNGHPAVLPRFILDPDNPVSIPMKGIIAPFIGHILKNEEAAGNARGKSQDVQDGITLAFE